MTAAKLPAAPGPLLVMGAGSVGGYVGACLQAAGAEVHFVGRPRTLGAWRVHGLRVTDQDGRDERLPPPALHLWGAVPASVTPALVLLTVKCGATREAAAALGAMLPAGTPVLSLQNGLGNADVGRAEAPALRWLPGMVPYNIAELGPGHLHRGTGGKLAAEDAPALRAWLPLFDAARLPLRLYDDLKPVQWGKLLLNLNNPVNALSGLPLRAELMQRGYRQVFAALQREALAALAAAGISPAQVAAVPPERLPTILSLPDWLFRRIAARMLRIDPEARSSMADDLALSRTTEVDALCGEVVRLARAQGQEAPLNQRIQALVEAWPNDPGPLPAAALKQRLGLH
ncbi:MAG TPA: 2-dehydropantoate 2-reductase [Ideonella sp.]|uniref:2-dehydropantoate 2-reductase n=1 Tax=Ideonella sp. TaxID=1929293 RepID=UPI002E2F7335|nr:2-dehydropantoate 2-reductase [Ideonella sp.]HEX5684085.1 2-dehydropantoate 2-reductase [Ideonella sp.]